jgi:hypothetical protein
MGNGVVTEDEHWWCRLLKKKTSLVRCHLWSYAVHSGPMIVFLLTSWYLAFTCTLWLSPVSHTWMLSPYPSSIVRKHRIVGFNSCLGLEVSNTKKSGGGAWSSCASLAT